jgi:hypothetical protein
MKSMVNKRTKKDKENALVYYAHLSRTHNTTLSILLTILAGYLAFIYLATTQRVLFTFELKITVSLVLIAVTSYTSIRYYNSGYQKSAVEDILGLKKIINEIGTKPEWLRDLSDKKRTSLEISILGIGGAVLISFFFLITMWYVFEDFRVLFFFSVILFIFCISFLIKNPKKSKLPTTTPQKSLES